jgi:hypothetical protein
MPESEVLRAGTGYAAGPKSILELAERHTGEALTNSRINWEMGGWVSASGLSPWRRP